MHGFKGIYLSKALTCMNIFLYKQKNVFFNQGGGYLWKQSIHLKYTTLPPYLQRLSNPQHAYQSFLSYFVVLPRGAMGLSAVCDCGMS